MLEVVRWDIIDKQPLILIEAQSLLRWVRVSVHPILDLHQNICFIEIIEAHLGEKLSLAYPKQTDSLFLHSSDFAAIVIERINGLHFLLYV